MLAKYSYAQEDWGRGLPERDS